MAERLMESQKLSERAAINHIAACNEQLLRAEVREGEPAFYRAHCRGLTCGGLEGSLAGKWLGVPCSDLDTSGAPFSLSAS